MSSAFASTRENMCKGTTCHLKVFEFDKPLEETGWKFVRFIMETSQPKIWYFVDMLIIKLTIRQHGDILAAQIKLPCVADNL
jgi:hypothetical protein